LLTAGYGQFSVSGSNRVGTLRPYSLGLADLNTGNSLDMGINSGVYISSYAPGANIALYGSNSWIRAQQLRINGVTETINYNGTWVKCFYVYDYNTGLQWKVPLIP
jgi:hypothetical protein